MCGFLFFFLPLKSLRIWVNEIFWKAKLSSFSSESREAMALFTRSSGGASASLLQRFVEHPLFIHTVPLLNFRCKQQRLLCISHYLVLTTFWSPKPKHCGILPSSRFLPARWMGSSSLFLFIVAGKTTYLLIKTCSVHFLLTFQSLGWAKIVLPGSHFKYNFSSNYAYIW